MPIFANVTQGPVSGIKSIQRGTITLQTTSTQSATATINAVVPGNCSVKLVSQSVLSAVDTLAEMFMIAGARLSLTNATTVTASIAPSSIPNDQVAIYVVFEIIEYHRVG